MSQTTYTTTAKSGLGARHGVTSELTVFLTVKPGEADALRAGLHAFHERIRNAPWDVVQKIGIVDIKHVIFDDDTRLIWNTTFDTDWDPYVDDAFAIIGSGPWTGWVQHVVEYDPADWTSSAGIKRFAQSAQVPAAAYTRAIPDLTLAQVKEDQRVKEAFEQVLDTPGAAEALQNPVLKPLLDVAAG
jgi:hypothetical protein